MHQSNIPASNNMNIMNQNNTAAYGADEMDNSQVTNFISAYKS